MPFEIGKDDQKSSQHQQNPTTSSAANPVQQAFGDGGFLTSGLFAESVKPTWRAKIAYHTVDKCPHCDPIKRPMCAKTDEHMAVVVVRSCRLRWKFSPFLQHDSPTPCQFSRNSYVSIIKVDETQKDRSLIFLIQTVILQEPKKTNSAASINRNSSSNRNSHVFDNCERQEIMAEIEKGVTNAFDDGKKMGGRIGQGCSEVVSCKELNFHRSTFQISTLSLMKGAPGLITNRIDYLKANDIVTVTLETTDSISLDNVQLTFRETYMSRADMYRYRACLVGRITYVDEQKRFLNINTRISDMWRKGSLVRSGFVTDKTRVVFRSSSSTVLIFIQMCSEMNQLDPQGDLYLEKCISFLSELFMNWKEQSCTHYVSIILCSRFYAVS